MPRPLRVFLCHASQDKPAVRKLHRYLKQHGIQPWLDQEDLLPGENWEVEIPRALNASDVILVCLSKNSVNKEGYVQKEISFALDKALEKPEGTIFIIPAKLEDCDVPKRLNRYQWVDLFRPDSNKRLLLGLNKRATSIGTDVLPVILEDTSVVKLPENQAIRKVFMWAGGLLAFALLALAVWKISQFPTAPDMTQTPPAITIVSTPTLGSDSTIISEKDGMTLVYVSEGEFTMGSNDGLLDEMPVHQLYLDAFWIDRTEVTNKQYGICVAAGMCEAPVQTGSLTRSNYFGDAKFNNYPVISVDWKRAKNYCEWANRRLPTEAEWEKAARGTNGYIYPWGRELPDSNLLNYNDEIGDTVEVGQYSDGASVYGALDMAGNVLEWVSSLYQPYPYTIYNGRENMGSLDARVLRGGSLSFGDYHVRTTYRVKTNPTTSSVVIGFRCARSP